MTLKNHFLLLACVCTVAAVLLTTTSGAVSLSAADSVNVSTEQNKTMTLSKSPTGAAVRSLIIPGWGQYYVQKYWKVPIFVGAAGVCAYLIIDNNNSFKDKKLQIKLATEADPNDPYIELYKRQREVYRDNRDQAVFCLIGVYLLSAIDAYVDAHLFDFNVSDKLTLNVEPAGINFVRVGLKVKF